LASPLYHFALAFLATACLLSGWFNRRGQTDRLILAIVLMVLIQASALGVANLTTRHLSLIPLIYITPLIPSIIGACVLLAPSLKKARPAANVPPG